MTGPRRRLRLFLIRIGIAALFVAALSNIVDLSEAFAVIGRIAPSTIAIVVMLFGMGQVLSCLRWRIALSQITPARPHLLALLRLYLIGMFVNIGIPTVAGGDVVRAEMLCRILGSRGGAYASIVVDRLIGILAVVLVAMVAIFAADELLPADTRLLVARAALLFGAGLLVLVGALRSLGAGRRWPRIKPFLAAIQMLATNPRILSLCLLIAVAVQTIAVILPIAMLARAMEIDIPIASHFLMVPIIILVTLLPIAPSGFGLREAAFVILYGQFGVAPEPAFALGLSWSLVLALFGLLGGLVMLLSGTDARPTHEG